MGLRTIPTAILLIGFSSGCAARAPARDATYGVLDAIQNPPPNDALARDVRALLQAYVERALRAGPPEDLGQLAARLTTEVMRATAKTAPETRALVGAMVNEALLAGLATLKRELPDLERTGARLAPAIEGHAERAGARLVRGVVDESVATIDHAPGGAPGPLAGALLAMAERTADATARGAAEGLRAELCTGGGASCGEDVIRATSRSAAMGAIEGVGREIGVWLLLSAFVTGAVVAAIAAWIVTMARRRRAG